jgi:hypothetical protein
VQTSCTQERENWILMNTVYVCAHTIKEEEEEEEVGNIRVRAVSPVL